MTKRQKDLLLKDLCARLTNGVICSIYREDDEGFGWRDAECKGYFQTNHGYEFYFEDVVAVNDIENIKPYLRPMSSMTKEEKEEERKLWDIVTTTRNDLHYLYTDFLVSHYFDYRGLIPMGLALEATEGMYNIK